MKQSFWTVVPFLAFSACSLAGPLSVTTVIGPSQPTHGGNARCVKPAAVYHRVNASVLLAILRIESGLSPSGSAQNDNGSVDHGIAGINSVNLPELARYGIDEEMLKDDCVATYVAAWYLRRKIEKHGQTWAGVASYHSATPYFNARYQLLVYNEMVRMGAIKGELKAVPPVKPAPALVMAYDNIVQNGGKF
jgi:hypothetical protein